MHARPLLSVVRSVRPLLSITMASKTRQHDMSCMASFRSVLENSEHLVILTGNDDDNDE